MGAGIPDAPALRTFRQKAYPCSDWRLMRLLALVTLTLLASQTAVSQRGVQLARIEGAVVDAITNQPLAGVQVSLARTAGQPPIAITKKDGRFALEKVEPGQHRVLATKENYVPGRAEGRKMSGNPGLSVTVSAGQPVKGLLFRLVPSGSIVGRVVDSRGKPVPKTQVAVARFTYDENGERVLSRVPGVLPVGVNDRGEFRLIELDPGAYHIEVQPRILMFDASGPGEAFLPVY